MSDTPDDVWSMLDREYLAEVVRNGPEPVFATISGAHLYGFASPDSDVDLRGAFLSPLRDVLGLHPPAETVTRTDASRIDLDYVAHDVRKFARLLTNHNGYVLEQLWSPLVVVASPAFAELRELSRGCMTRPTARHYAGFARGRRRRLREAGPTVKHLLYAYRVLLTGIHLMRAHEVVADLRVLVETRRLDGVAELLERKRTGSEQGPLDADELTRHEPQLDELERVLTESAAVSRLPDEATTTAALDAFVVRLRLESGREGSQ